MFSKAWLVCALLPLGLACGSTSRDVDDDDGASSGAAAGSTSGSGAGSSTSGSGGSSSNSSSTGTGAGTPSYPLCLATCSTASDCGIGTPAFDADNYTCDQGHCRYDGCNNDGECQAQGAFVCREAFDPLMLGGSTICVYACQTPADCALGAGPAWDEDNYDCVDGGCQYTGCNSEAECQGQTGNLTCRDTGAGVAYCQQACSTAADCDLGGGSAYDADNYACDAGVCLYRGCNDDSECASLGAYECAAP